MSVGRGMGPEDLSIHGIPGHSRVDSEILTQL